jgi:hypothetical protein
MSTFDVMPILNQSAARRFRFNQTRLSFAARDFIDEHHGNVSFSGDMGVEAAAQYHHVARPASASNAAKCARRRAKVKADGRKVVLTLGPINTLAAQALKDRPEGATATVEALGLSLAGVVS